MIFLNIIFLCEYYTHYYTVTSFIFAVTFTQAGALKILFVLFLTPFTARYPGEY